MEVKKRESKKSVISNHEDSISNTKKKKCPEVCEFCENKSLSTFIYNILDEQTKNPNQFRVEKRNLRYFNYFNKLKQFNNFFSQGSIDNSLIYACKCVIPIHKVCVIKLMIFSQNLCCQKCGIHYNFKATNELGICSKIKVFGFCGSIAVKVLFIFIFTILIILYFKLVFPIVNEELTFSFWNYIIAICLFAILLGIMIQFFLLIKKINGIKATETLEVEEYKNASDDDEDSKQRILESTEILFNFLYYNFKITISDFSEYKMLKKFCKDSSSLNKNLFNFINHELVEGEEVEEGEEKSFSSESEKESERLLENTIKSINVPKSPKSLIDNTNENQKDNSKIIEPTVNSINRSDQNLLNLNFVSTKEQKELVKQKTNQSANSNSANPTFIKVDKKESSPLIKLKAVEVIDSSDNSILKLNENTQISRKYEEDKHLDAGTGTSKLTINEQKSLEHFDKKFKPNIETIEELSASASQSPETKKPEHIKFNNIEDFDDSKSSKPLDVSADIPKNFLNLNNKHENILKKLKDLKSKAVEYGEKQSIIDLNWILSTINDNDLFEPIRKPRRTNEEEIDKEHLDVIAAFSKGEKEDNMINELKKVRKAEQMKTIRKSTLQHNPAQLKKLISDIQEEDEDEVNTGGKRDIKSIRTSTKYIHTLSNDILIQAKPLLNKIDTYEFNIFELDALFGKNSLFHVLNEIFNKYHFIEELLIEEKYVNFVKEIISGYDRNVPYHNDLHATDVLQTTHLLILKGNLEEKLRLSDMDIMATLIGAACHDFKHNGFNNTYHINSYSDIAVQYNDVSVLENFHVSESFKILLKEMNNPFGKLEPEQFRTFRRRMIDCILATDMAFHSKKLTGLKNMLEAKEIKNGENLDKLYIEENDAKNNDIIQQMILSQCVHTADLSNPAKLNEVFSKWTDLVYTEFFNQGDNEKANSVTVSMLCDRETTNISKSQIGFIKFVVIPQFETMLNIIPECSVYMSNINTNLKYFENEIEKQNAQEVAAK